AQQERDKAVAEKERADTEAATAAAVSEFLQKNVFEQASGPSTATNPATTNTDPSMRGSLARAVSKIDGKYDKQPLVEAGVREAVANAYLGLGAFNEAVTQFNKALELRRKVQGEADRHTLDAMTQIAGVYLIQGRNSEAEDMLRRVYEGRRKTLGEGHIETV